MIIALVVNKATMVLIVYPTRAYGVREVLGSEAWGGGGDKTKEVTLKLTDVLFPCASDRVVLMREPQEKGKEMSGDRIIFLLPSTRPFTSC